MLVAPGEQRPQHRAEVPASLRQQVGVARRVFAVAGFLQQTGFDEAAQAARQYVRRDSEAFLKLVEPRQAAGGVAQDQDASTPSPTRSRLRAMGQDLALSPGCGMG